MSVNRRNFRLRHRIAGALFDGEWKTAQEIAHHFLDEGWAFGSVRQIAAICNRTPGIASRHPGKVTYNQYRLHSMSEFTNWMARKSTNGEMLTTQYLP